MSNINQRRGNIPKYLREGYESEHERLGVQPTAWDGDDQRPRKQKPVQMSRPAPQQPNQRVLIQGGYPQNPVINAKTATGKQMMVPFVGGNDQTPAWASHRSFAGAQPPQEEMEEETSDQDSLSQELFDNEVDNTPAGSFVVSVNGTTEIFNNPADVEEYIVSLINEDIDIGEIHVYKKIPIRFGIVFE